MMLRREMARGRCSLRLNAPMSTGRPTHRTPCATGFSINERKRFTCPFTVRRDLRNLWSAQRPPASPDTEEVTGSNPATPTPGL
jgi:hypothetical protein